MFFAALWMCLPAVVAPPARCLKWDYVKHPVRVTVTGKFEPGRWPRWAFDGYPTSLAQPYAREFWHADLPTPEKPEALTVDYGQPVAATRYVHYFERFRTPCAWKDVDLLASDDGEHWTLRGQFTNLPPDCPQVLPL